MTELTHNALSLKENILAANIVIKLRTAKSEVLLFQVSFHHQIGNSQGKQWVPRPSSKPSIPNRCGFLCPGAIPSIGAMPHLTYSRQLLSTYYEQGLLQVPEIYLLQGYNKTAPLGGGARL